MNLSTEMPLILNAENHSYSLDGSWVPGVTGILEEFGLMPKYPDVEFYKLRGSAVHLATALHDQGRLAKVDPRIEGYLEAWKAFLKNSEARVVLVEHPAVCRTYRFAGTIDRLLDIGGRLTVVDLKAGEPAAAAALQTAGYSRLLKSQNGIIADSRMAVRVQQDGSYKVTEHPDHPGDDRTFLYALSLSHWKRQKGIR